MILLLLPSIVAARALNTKTNMVPIDTVVESSSTFLSQFSQLMASEMDFGGYAGPAGSLLFIAAIIVTLAPPLESPDSTTPY